MGGLFSGGGRGASKLSSFHTIDLMDLKRMGLLGRLGTHSITWSRSGKETGRIQIALSEQSMELIYKTRKDGGYWQDIRENVWFDCVPQHFGGHRTWFLCPGCDQRTRALHAGLYFRCRRCYGAVYPSQYQNAAERACTRAHTIRKNLGGSVSLCDSFPLKPKGMHWRTYDRLKQEHDELEQRWIGYMAYKLGVAVI